MMTPSHSLPTDALFRRAQDVTLWLMAALHLLLLLSFLLVLGSLSPANAQTTNAQTPACTGKDLMAELQSSNPALYRQVVSQGEPIPNGKGLFWKIEKPGIAPSWLLGTMHVSDPRVLKMPPGADEAHRQAKTIVIESVEVLDEKKSATLLLMKPELSMFTDGRTLPSLMSKEDRLIVEEGLKKRGVSFAAVSRMKPWLLMAPLALPACEAARKQNTAFLDRKIALDATAAGKQVKGLETLEEQIGAINSVPIDMQVRSIVEAVKFGSRMDDLFFTMIDLYARQQIGMVTPLVKAIAGTEGADEQGYAEFERIVVVKRNHLMAERAAPILSEGSAFIAVGALHLPGEEGLVELLRKQGFKVTAVN